MHKVYVVEESTWDHHCNVAMFTSYPLAEAFCNKWYTKLKIENRYQTDPLWSAHGMHYSIEEYDVSDSI